MEPLATVTRSRGIQKRPHSVTLYGRKIYHYNIQLKNGFFMSFVILSEN